MTSRAQRIHQQRRVEQGVAEMLGLIRGVIADGLVSQDEAQRLSEWARQNPETATRYPANLLSRRLERIFSDGRLDTRERTRLAAMLTQLAEHSGGMSHGYPLATDLPLTDPAPEVAFEGQTFVFGGELAYGPLHACEREVVELGGVCESSVNRRTDFVVIGSLAASDWSQAAFGPLIDDVVLYRARGVSIAVITEEHWAAALP